MAKCGRRRRMKTLNSGFDLKRAWVFLFLVFFACMVFLVSSDSLHAVSLKVLAVSVLILALCVFFAYKAKLPRFALLLGALALILRVVIVFVIPTEPFSDFYVLLNASQSLIDGDMSYQSSGYFSL